MNIYAEQRAMLARMVRMRDETCRHIEIIGGQFGRRAERIAITAFRNLKNRMRRSEMIVLITLSVVMVMAMCSLAYMLATYAVPFLVAVMATRFAFAIGAGYLGAVIVGLFAGVGNYGFLAYLYATLRSPKLRLAVALIFAVPAAIAGFAMVHGITREAVPSEVWRKIFSLIGGSFVGASALARLRAGRKRLE